MKKKFDFQAVTTPQVIRNFAVGRANIFFEDIGHACKNIIGPVAEGMEKKKNKIRAE